ncbi:tetratricopeptide repeat-containing glycosyltransferase family protein [Ramlibacter sp. AN1015]|uniref:tetratricopeptide repeat-containing glycosyltransferase family protein n=1 Tax=Ramlibacter sp. AN1015 TaxID=3133428 RepID=UPI0030BCB218
MPEEVASPQRIAQLLSQAVEAHAGQDLERARLLYEQVLQMHPRQPHVPFLLGTLLHAQGAHAAAIGQLEQAVRLRPQELRAWVLLGGSMAHLERWPEVLACFEGALSLEPMNADALAGRATALHALDRSDEAARCFDQALEIAPGHEVALLNRCRLRRDRGELQAALADCDAVLAQSPAHARAAFSKAGLLLLQGEWARGWPLYEQRFAALGISPDRFGRPLWRGGDSFASWVTILLHNDQALGDGIMNMRFATEVAAKGARVILAVAPTLVELARGVEGVTEVVAHGKPLPHFDVHCPFFSLPAALQLTVETVPGRSGYLRADAARAAAWAAELGPADRPRVGLAWSGNPEHSRDRRRSITLERFLTALPEGCEYISLQKELRTTDEGALAATPRVRYFGDRLRDFSDTAALCAQMDLVVAVDTSVAHLAGALGKPVWILLPYSPDCRWLMHGERCPWYASARLLRQGPEREWPPVLAQVHSGLQQLAHAWAGTPA